MLGINALSQRFCFGLQLIGPSFKQTKKGFEQVRSRLFLLLME